MKTGNIQSGAKPHKIWINDRWYIPIDEKGQVPGGLCAEGALGFVIQLQSDVEKGHHKALKIPRLMGETRRENAYINELAEKELNSVRAIFDGSGGTNGLLNADTTHGSPLRGPISIQRGSEEAQQWHKALIFVSFKKGQNPTFCLVRFDDKLPRYYPAETDCPFKDKEIAFYEKIKTKAKGGPMDWEHTVFIEAGEIQEAGHRNAPNILAVDEAFSETDAAGRTWYTCLPSVIYDWAPFTLQESISRDHRKGPWDKGKHFALIEQVCRGLVTMHDRNMLHADIRPANMVYKGAADDPKNYYLSDYGSFSDPGARVSSGHNPEGTTVLGPVVSGERISAFYAPERRNSRERESANTAVIHKSTPDDLYVILGWGSELIDSTTNKPTNELKGIVNPDSLKRYENEDQSNLVKGDRIQVREYIFDVEQEWHVGNKQVLRCKSRCWKIYHGRIVVENDEPFQDWNTFPIPRTVELRQWSAATDLYSLGAMALYSVFCNSVYKQGNKSVDNSQLEDDFRIMLGYLESPPFFNAIWPELEWMRSQLEAHLDKTGQTEELLADQNFKGYTGEPREKEERKLKGAVVALVGRITQSVPRAREVVEELDFDLGTFIFFIHFVLCCLHRQSEVKVPDVWKEIESIKPFAKDRLEKPEPGGAAAKALERIKKISKLIDDRLLGGLKLKPDEELTTKIPGFELRSTSEILVELNQTKADLLQTMEELDQKNSMLRRFETAVDEALKITNSWLALIRIGDLKKTLRKAKDTETQS